MTKKICQNIEENGMCKLWERCDHRKDCGAKVYINGISSPLNIKSFRKGSRLAYQDSRHWNNKGGLNK